VSRSSSEQEGSKQEGTLVLLIGAVQFVNILDFVMVMPLGPDFARALGIPAAKLGFVGGSYTAAAAIAGIAGSFFLDRFDRRLALGVALFGLALGTAAGGLATGMTSLLAARVVAGAFGGPATSLAFSIIADQVPSERRGRAVGAVMAAFSAATVLGVPLGLELAERAGWRAPFFAVAGLGLLVNAAVFALLPPMRGHLERRASDEPAPTLRELVGRREVMLSYAMTAVVMMGGFLLIPNLSAYVQKNLHFPRVHLGWLYLAGGVVSFFTARWGGRLIDRLGSFRVGTVGAVILLAVQLGFFVLVPPGVPVIAYFMAFMLGLGLRNVSYNTLTTKVPSARERARFLSIQSAVQHASSAAGAFVSAQMLREGADHELIGMNEVAGLAMALTALVPFMLWNVERRVAPRPATRS
jgi:predicted MFS family arabinose efflux permease